MATVLYRGRAGMVLRTRLSRYIALAQHWTRTWLIDRSVRSQPRFRSGAYYKDYRHRMSAGILASRGL